MEGLPRGHTVCRWGVVELGLEPGPLAPEMELFTTLQLRKTTEDGENKEGKCECVCKDPHSKWLKLETKFPKLENFRHKNVTLGSDKHPLLQPENGDTVWANPGSLGIKSPHRGI